MPPTRRLTPIATSRACALGAPAPKHPPPLLQSDWRVVQRGYYAHVLGEAPHTFEDPVEAVRALKKDNSVSGGRRLLRRLFCNSGCNGGAAGHSAAGRSAAGRSAGWVGEWGVAAARRRGAWECMQGRARAGRWRAAGRCPGGWRRCGLTRLSAAQRTCVGGAPQGSPPASTRRVPAWRPPRGGGPLGLPSRTAQPHCCYA